MINSITLGGRRLHSDFFGKKLSLVIKDNNYILSTKIKEVAASEEEIADAVRENGSKIFKVESIFMKDILNCIIKDGILYLDSDIPFSTQMRKIESLKYYFSIEYQAIHFDGNINFLGVIANFNNILAGKKIITSKDSENEERKNADLFASIKLKFRRLHDGFKEYIDDRISDIYATSEERLANLDLTKPFESSENHSIYSQLTKLNERIPIFIEATDYLEEWEKVDFTIAKHNINKLSEPYKTRQLFQFSKDRDEFIKQVIENTIAKAEGREFTPIEELATNFAIRQAKQCQLVNDYYSKNIPVSQVLSNNSQDFELIIARIESVFSYYKITNPYITKIAECRRQLRLLNGKPEARTEFNDNYQNLLNIFNESEKIALKETISSWKTHKNKIIFGSNPILVLIGSFVELYNEYIDKWIEYEENKEKRFGIIMASPRLEAAFNRIHTKYEPGFQAILDRISNDDYHTDTMVQKGYDEVYREALDSFKKLIDRIKKDLRNEQVHDCIKKLANNEMVDIEIEDSKFHVIFIKASEASQALQDLMHYAIDEDIFNNAVLKEYYETNKKEYDDIISRVDAYYKSGNDREEEYDKIIESLDILISTVKTICSNEARVLEEVALINKHKKSFRA